jgi:hypothetical protein
LIDRKIKLRRPGGRVRSLNRRLNRTFLNPPNTKIGSKCRRHGFF